MSYMQDLLTHIQFYEPDESVVGYGKHTYTDVHLINPLRGNM